MHYTVIYVIIYLADLPCVETDPRNHLNTSCHWRSRKDRVVSCFLYKGIRIGEVGYENFPIYSLALLLFLEKKEIRKIQGRYKEGASWSDYVISEMAITGSNRESIPYLLHLRLLYYSALYLFIRYWVTLLYQYTVYTVIILGYSSSPYLLFSIFNLGLLYYTNVIWSYIFLLGRSSRPRFYNKSIIFYGSILYFWFSLVDQCSMIYYYKIGSLYRTSIIHLYQLHIGSLYWPIFLYIIYVLGLLYHTNLIFGFL